jgi:hypothetical protein
MKPPDGPSTPEPFLDNNKFDGKKSEEKKPEGKYCVMPELVVIVASDSEQRAVLQVLVDGTSVARTTHSAPAIPLAAAIRSSAHSRLNPDVILVDAVNNTSAALRDRTLRHELPETAVFAISMAQPRSYERHARGRQEFIERPPPLRTSSKPSFDFPRRSAR